MAAPDCWLFTLGQLSDSPSRRDGVSAEEEHRLRWEGAQLIRDAGNALNQQPGTYCTGITLFHRFYALYSFRGFPHMVSSASLDDSGPPACPPASAYTCLSVQQYLAALVFYPGLPLLPSNFLLIRDVVIPAACYLGHWLPSRRSLHRTWPPRVSL